MMQLLTSSPSSMVNQNFPIRLSYIYTMTDWSNSFIIADPEILMCQTRLPYGTYPPRLHLRLRLTLDQEGAFLLLRTMALRFREAGSHPNY